MKRFISIILAVAMCCMASVSVFAYDAEAQMVTEQANDAVSPLALGKVIATGAGTIYNGYGTINVVLPSGNFSADLLAQIGYVDRSGIIECTVRTPSGDYLDLGAMSGSGSATSTYNVLYAEAGTYYFTFTSTITTPIEVVCYIYD